MMKSKMAAEHTQRVAGTAFVLKASTPSYSWIPSVIFAICLCLLSTRQRLSTHNNKDKDNVFSLAPGSQYLLYSVILHDGRARTPSTSTKKDTTTPANTIRRLLFLTIMALLAGDVEVNPGPQALGLTQRLEANNSLLHPATSSTTAAYSAELTTSRTRELLALLHLPPPMFRCYLPAVTAAVRRAAHRPDEGVHHPDINASAAANPAGPRRGQTAQQLGADGGIHHPDTNASAAANPAGPRRGQTAQQLGADGGIHHPDTNASAAANPAGPRRGQTAQQLGADGVIHHPDTNASAAANPAGPRRGQTAQQLGADGGIHHPDTNASAAANPAGPRRGQTAQQLGTDGGIHHPDTNASAAANPAGPRRGQTAQQLGTDGGIHHPDTNDSAAAQQLGADGGAHHPHTVTSAAARLLHPSTVSAAAHPTAQQLNKVMDQGGHRDQEAGQDTINRDERALMLSHTWDALHQRPSADLSDCQAGHAFKETPADKDTSRHTSDDASEED
ncbi:uncharacterized protein LOC125886569 [Epinephelus fuscoguttatus]|uniref:uncharacterized protein LOC125886569 n=1 Tax=Epinephelus fuscoguttatus TaxID=293821 RepID=UPI0020D01125|nr:uncharacterized protein LOC125886569 [Epinephelus fuscoguttatus]XP_049428837.1 uncharacterized protein LOC125886569 [Epinephelus fuscoguttatus]XP_049428838.1 uncharacterized protein LOC125886569 [Epinephelus fuscoguttatus]XP_049428839.1 uncharacterized protein LOC125886569 [Epinephelus fuscoguttatus]XP_049428840.1 uncharacterized protein LOC125886569 [Epinephelus fuscoguttatus]XP_049428842.1 uncharacterized protein LOC125886569 [Epinephelus fuscoguttatus]